MLFNVQSRSVIARLLLSIPLTATLGVANGKLDLQLSILKSAVIQPSGALSGVEGVQAKSLALGAPLSVRVVLRNTSSRQPILMPSSIDPAWGHIRFVLTDPDGVTQRFTTYRWAFAPDSVSGRTTLEPGEQLVFETFLLGKLKNDEEESFSVIKSEYLFEGKGQYHLSTEFISGRSSDVPLESNPVLINIQHTLPRLQKLRNVKYVEVVEKLRAGVDVSDESVEQVMIALRDAGIANRNESMYAELASWVTRRRSVLKRSVEAQP